MTRNPNMREAILSAAELLFSTRGFNAVSIRDIALEAGAMGERDGDIDATAVLLEQVYILSWLRGRLDDVVDAVGLYSEATPLSTVARVARAHALAHCGRLTEARAVLEFFSADGFAGMPTTVVPGATSFVTTEPAPTVASSPTDRY